MIQLCVLCVKGMCVCICRVFTYPVQLVGLISSGIVFIVILWLGTLFEPLPKVSDYHSMKTGGISDALQVV